MDRGLLYGEGLLETIRVVGGVGRHVDRHLARLARSAAALGLPAPPDPVELPGRDGLVRLTWTAGPAPAGPFDEGPRTDPRLLVSWREAGPETEVRLWPLAFRPGEHAAHKTLARWPYLRARAAARAAGYDDALLMDGADTLEGTASNLVARLDGALVTPPADGRILPGIGRELVLLERQVAERRLTLADLARASAVWLVGSTMLAPRPVVAIGDHRYPADVLA